MSYVELYNKDILDVASLGQIATNFNESNGDYIKVEIFRGDSDIVLNTFFSNRLLLMYPEVDDYYIGHYHYHPESPGMGFCTEKEHNNNSITNLRPIPVGNNNVGGPINTGIKYKNQFDIFKDDVGKIYIKPNEIFKLVKLGQSTYKLRIYFLRNIKSTLGSFLALHKNNLIENGNFFAGLEATQTGDIDSSTGRNNFVAKNNPGFSPYTLEQDGIGNNIYNMRVTGIEPNTSYIFSCWVAWNNGFNGDKNIVYFNNAGNGALPTQDNTDLAGSWISYEEKDDVRILLTKNAGGEIWYKLFVKVYTNENATFGSIDINLGTTIEYKSSNPIGRRYFTDLRFEKVENFDVALLEYIDKLKIEGGSY